MKIGLVSDTHDNMPMIKKAVDCFNDRKVDLVLHAGDIISPFCASEFSRLKSRFIAVFGNNDGEKRIWREKIKSLGEIHDGSYSCELGGVQFLLMHEPWQLEALALSRKLDIIIYGHTHKVHNHIIGGTLVLNPGECCGWLSGKSTIAVLEVPQKNVEIISLN